MSYFLKSFKELIPSNTDIQFLIVKAHRIQAGKLNYHRNNRFINKNVS
jgi:hypothetical protein